MTLSLLDSRVPCLVLLGILAFALANAQLGPVPSAFNIPIQEVTQRVRDSYVGFVYDMFDPKNAVDITPNGNATTNFIQNNPFLATLPGDGAGQNVLRLGPCAGNTIHTHPRGSEISHVLYGSMTFGMIEENQGHAPQRNNLVLTNITQGQTIHIPQGLLHFSFNDNCAPAAFLANFGNRDPGTQSIWNSVMQVPSPILHLSSGLPEATFNLLKTYPLVLAPGTGGEACLKRCGLDFYTANNFIPNANSDSQTTTFSLPAAPGLGMKAQGPTAYAPSNYGDGNK